MDHAREGQRPRAPLPAQLHQRQVAKRSNGWFYHFNDVHTGERWKEVEISTSDCIWLLAGALTCRQYFHEDHEIGDLATLLYSRYDFPWMTNGDGKLLSHGWKPVAGHPATASAPALRQILPACCDVSARHRRAVSSAAARGLVRVGAQSQHLRELQLHRHVAALDVSISVRVVRLPRTPRESRQEGDWFDELRDRHAGSSRVVLHRHGARTFPSLTRRTSGASRALRAPRATRRGAARPSTRRSMAASFRARPGAR